METTERLKRIEDDAIEYTNLISHTSDLIKEACKLDFTAGAKSERNKAIDEAIEVIHRICINKDFGIKYEEELNKLRV